MAIIKCKECQKEISSSARVCPSCGKQLKIPVWQIVIGVTLLFISLNVFIGAIEGMSENYSTQTSVTQSSKNSISKANYDKIKEGMTEEVVKSILGNPNTSAESTMEGVGKIKLKQYKNWTTNIQIYFLEGKVYMKNWIEL